MEPSRIKFDPTINLGHLLTFIGFIVAIFVGWTNLDKRVVVLEEGRHAQLQRDIHQDKLNNQQFDQVTASLREVKVLLMRLEDKLDDQKGKP
jgi:hypothetical protein